MTERDVLSRLSIPTEPERSHALRLILRTQPRSANSAPLRLCGLLSGFFLTAETQRRREKIASRPTRREAGEPRLGRPQLRPAPANKKPLPVARKGFAEQACLELVDDVRGRENFVLLAGRHGATER
jgi:hypothetical protein